MPGFFYQLGKKAGPLFRQGNWLIQNLTGTPEQAIAAEYDVGRDLAAQIRAGYSPEALAVSPQHSQWLDQIHQKLTACLLNKHRRFAVTLVHDGPPNAFALPGGFLFVEQSLLELCDWNPDEAAFVIAHEIGHVVEAHAIERLVGDRVLGQAIGRLPIGGMPGMLLRQAAALFISTAYSREQEFSADHFAARLTTAAGFDPAGGTRLFRRLQTLEHQQDTLPLADYFASHPPLADRIAAINRQIGPAALPRPNPN
jgi:predicted Zn-dependent protease